MAGPGDLTGAQLRYFGAIQSAARVHATTAETWEAIRSVAAATGETLPPGMFTAVNQMRALGVGLRNAAEAIGAANHGMALESSMIGVQPYTRSGAAGIVPSYDVRFQVRMTYPDGTVNDEWLIRQYPTTLPATVGDLYADLADTAGLMMQIGSPPGAVQVGEIVTVEIGSF